MAVAAQPIGPVLIGDEKYKIWSVGHADLLRALGQVGCHGHTGMARLSRDCVQATMTIMRRSPWQFGKIHCKEWHCSQHILTALEALRRSGKFQIMRQFSQPGVSDFAAFTSNLASALRSSRDAAKL